MPGLLHFNYYHIKKTIRLPILTSMMPEQSGPWFVNAYRLKVILILKRGILDFQPMLMYAGDHRWAVYNEQNLQFNRDAQMTNKRKCQCHCLTLY